MDLDDVAGFGAVDRADALGDLEATPAQWAQTHGPDPVRLDLSAIDSVVVTGMGGSGICGDVLQAVSTLAVPVVVSKGYDLPSFTGPRTLVVAVSHSGNTEETVSAAGAAVAAGASLFAVTGGGDLAALCDEAGAPWARVPASGRPPRHSLGSLVVPALVALGMDDDLDDAVAALHTVAAAAHRDVPAERNPAKRLGARLASGGLPLLWGARGGPAVAAYRLRCQLNENAKLPAATAELPELDHNEVVAWQETTPLTGSAGLVCFRDPAEHPRVALRFEVTVGLLADRLAWCEEVSAVGTSPLGRLASLMLHADFASVYAALALDRDPTPILNIDRLKAELAS